MSILSDKVAAYVKADNEVTTLESQQNELAKTLADARRNRDTARDLAQTQFLEDGDQIITIALDEGSAATLIRESNNWCAIHVGPMDTEASFIPVAAALAAKAVTTG